MTKPYIDQARDHILNTCLPLLQEQHRKILIPCLRVDYEIYKAALELEEVKSAIAQKKIEIELVIVDSSGKLEAQIIIATIDDVASGKLDKYL